MEKTSIVIKQSEKGMLLFINNKKIEGVTYLDVSLNGDKEVNLTFSSSFCNLVVLKED